MLDFTKGKRGLNRARSLKLDVQMYEALMERWCLGNSGDRHYQLVNHGIWQWLIDEQLSYSYITDVMHCDDATLE